MKISQEPITNFERVTKTFSRVVKAFNPFNFHSIDESTYEQQVIRFSELWTGHVWLKQKIGEKDYWELCVFCSFLPCGGIFWKLQERLKHIASAGWLELKSMN